MRKLILLSSAILVLAAGCNKAINVSTTPSVQNSNTSIVPKQSTSVPSTATTIPVATQAQKPQPKPTITSFSLTSGPILTHVTVTGTGFTSGNGIVTTDGILWDPTAYSTNGTSLTFIVPTYPCTYSVTIGCKTVVAAPVVGNTYKLTVVNANGTSNAMPFTVTASAAGALNLSPSSLNFTMAQGSESFSPAQTLTASGATGDWTATVTNPSGNWLLVNGGVPPISASFNSKITVSVNTYGLTPGTYKASIVFSQYSGEYSTQTFSPVTVPVTLVVTN